MKRLILFVLAGVVQAADLRVGIVGTDTSHVTAFASILNDPANKDHLPGARIVAAWKGGSPDLPSSRDRVEKFAAELQSKYGVELVPDIATLLTKVDAVLLESVDGRVHLAQFREVLKGGKPVFIDKPLASTLADAREIARLATEAKVPWFSTSSLRYSRDLPSYKLPGLTGVFLWAPGPFDATHQLDLSWYGIHGVEMLYTLMGRGCVEVTRTSAADAEIVTGRWSDGRTGVLRLVRPYSDYGVVAFAGKVVKASTGQLYTGYRDLLVEVLRFFQSKVPPVRNEETLEIFAFMDAAQRSKDSGGRPAPVQ